MPPIMGLPFVVLLLVIALAPLIKPRWWHDNGNKARIALLVSLPIVVFMMSSEPGRHILAEKAHEYLGFIVVIGALFVIAGGVHIEGSLSGTPAVNTAMLGCGAILANLVGTTGASVLLIRPLLRANKRRKRVAHIVIFFIFIVANCGGLLTPVGDPPLLLGFLKGVPFDWTLRLWPQWLMVNGLLLLIFNFWDERALERDEYELPGSQHEQVLIHEPLRIRGGVEIAALLGVLLTIVAAGSSANAGKAWQPGIQETMIVLLAVVGYFAGSHERRTKNVFTFGPLIEVAVLFAAIFVTMAPVLEILNVWSRETQSLTKPWQFFWASGALSSVLDNAPTYLSFAAAASGLHGIPPHGPYIGALTLDAESARVLAAISTGSVFMGANTYIGNAPNFMIRSIAQENGITMPSFFGYMVYSLGILLPIFVAVSVLFFR